MSESEDETFDDTLDDSEEQVLRKRALIDTVRPCPALYAKTKKEYCGKNFNKDLAWETVGAAQVPPLSGDEAKKTFYKMRQKFGKEWRKHLDHLKGKSGQGASTPFTSSWALYDEMKFLGDHITPRKTRTTYKSGTTSKCVKNLCSVPSPTPSTSSGCGSLWNADLKILTGCNEVSEASTSDSASGKTEPTASEQVLKAMEVAAKGSKRTPQPDSFASKRQKADKEFMDTMIAQGNALTSVHSGARSPKTALKSIS